MSSLAKRFLHLERIYRNPQPSPCPNCSDPEPRYAIQHLQRCDHKSEAVLKLLADTALDLWQSKCFVPEECECPPIRIEVDHNGSIVNTEPEGTPGWREPDPPVNSVWDLVMRTQDPGDDFGFGDLRAELGGAQAAELPPSEDGVLTDQEWISQSEAVRHARRSRAVVLSAPGPPPRENMPMKITRSDGVTIKRQCRRAWPRAKALPKLDKLRDE